MERIRFCSLDFLIYAHELRLEEEELLDEGCIETHERLSIAEMRKSYENYLKDGDSNEWLWHQGEQGLCIVQT